MLLLVVNKYKWIVMGKSFNLTFYGGLASFNPRQISQKRDNKFYSILSQMSSFSKWILFVFVL